MSEDRDLVGPEAFAHNVDQLVEVGDELPDGHRGSGDFAVERFAGPALIPVDNGEALFERRVEVTKKTHLCKARPPVQKDQRRIGKALAADHDPLIETTEPEIVDLRDAAGNGLAPRPKEGRGLSETLHAIAPVPAFTPPASEAVVARATRDWPRRPRRRPRKCGQGLSAFMS